MRVIGGGWGISCISVIRFISVVEKLLGILRLLGLLVLLGLLGLLTPPVQDSFQYKCDDG